AAGTLEYSGKVAAAQNSDMAFEVPGKIIEFVFREGVEVEQGDVLARLDPRDYQARLDSAQAKLNQSKSEYGRNQALFKADVIAKQELERKQRAFQVDEASVREARKALDDTVLRATFSGVMAKKLVRDFQNVKAKEPVLVQQDLSSREIQLDVPEADLRYSRGRPATPEESTARLNPRVVVTTFPDRSFPARVKEISTTADPVTRTFEATLQFDNPTDVRVLPGMTAKIVITVAAAGKVGGFSIPASAIVPDEAGEAFVWVVDPSTMEVHRTHVVVGELSGSKVEVRSGLASGDRIAVSGVHQLREGMQVRPFES
ncbi:MAG: efflux RND transporter periplasmic adaptor subunit, partial [Myxococcota bacterium]